MDVLRGVTLSRKGAKTLFHPIACDSVPYYQTAHDLKLCSESSI
jgi:hypothetical protein